MVGEGTYGGLGGIWGPGFGFKVQGLGLIGSRGSWASTSTTSHGAVSKQEASIGILRLYTE